MVTLNRQIMSCVTLDISDTAIEVTRCDDSTLQHVLLMVLLAH